MNRQFDPADFLDEPVNKQEVRARRITCDYTLSEILAATEEKASSGDNKENNGKEAFETDTPKTDRDVSESEREWADWKEAIESIDIDEIRNYAENAFHERGGASGVTYTAQNGSGTNLSTFVNPRPTDRKDEPAQRHKGSTRPDMRGYAQAGTGTDDPDRYSTDENKEHPEGATETTPPKDPNPEAESQFKELEESEGGISTRRDS